MTLTAPLAKKEKVFVSDTLETLETVLENARQHKTPVQLVLGGRFEAPVTAHVLRRNGQTFEFAVGTAVLSAEVSAIILRTGDVRPG